MRYTARLTVAAPLSRVWKVLTDVARWPEWTTSISSVTALDGALRLGSRVEITQPGLRSATWTVVEFVPGRSFVWTASQPGVTTSGAHHVGAENDTTTLTLTLTQTGPLAGPVSLLLGRRMRRYVDLETAGIAAAARAAPDDHTRYDRGAG